MAGEGGGDPLLAHQCLQPKDGGPVPGGHVVAKGAVHGLGQLAGDDPVGTPEVRRA